MSHRRGRIGLFLLSGLTIAFLIVTFFAPGSGDEQDLYRTLERPSGEHWLGTDHLGRDFLKRLALGLRTTLGIGLGSTAVALLLGTTIGMLAGYKRGPLEYGLLRAIDVILSIPGLILALVIVSILGRGNESVLIALIVRAFPSFTRVAHSATLKVMGQDFIVSAVSFGANSLNILVRHVLPNIFLPIVVIWPILLGIGVLISASLSFFRLGVQPPTPELGLLIDDGRRYVHLKSALLWYPGLVLVATNVGLSFLSDGLRETLDPLFRDRSREQ